jgi:ABC-type transporter Mla maintaining outer membrane lipid asymmetry permease subunit MlaE
MNRWPQMILLLSPLLLAVSVGVKPEARHTKVVFMGFKHLLLSCLEWFGEIGQFCVRLVKAAVTPPFEAKELLRQMDEIGAKSVPLVALAGAAIGVVLSLHTRESLIRFGAKSLLPTLIILSIVKESGPIITALVVSGRVAQVLAQNWAR